ncbi:MAG TPA: hypothetical protein VFE72_06835, partial [Lysobacter sp.]|nr:hypothetical protein [Lysobacter sp.]
AAAVYSTMPIAYLLSSTLFVENLWTLWWTAALVLMERLHRRAEPSVAPYLATGALIGAALASKVMTAFWSPIVLVFVVLAWRRRVLDLRRLAMIALPAVLIGLWPYAVAWFETSNPVFPFMNAIFRSPLYPAREPFTTPFNAGIGFDTLYALTFHTDRYLEAEPGGAGFAWLALLPAGLIATMLARRVWIRALAVTSVLFVSACFAFTAYARYVAPVAPVWAALIAAGLATGHRRAVPTLASGTAMATGLLGLAFLANATWWYRAPPPVGLLGRDGYAEWLQGMRPEHTVVDRINGLRLRHVLWVGRGYYPGLKADVTTTGWHQNSGWNELRTRSDLDAWIARLGIDGVVLAPGVNACDSLLCSAVATLGEPDTISGGARFYRVRPGTLNGLAATPTRPAFAVERLRDPDLNGTGAAWAGNGEWDTAHGIMKVDASRLFSQGVRVAGGKSYRYRIVARCVGQPGHYRAQVNWLRGDGSIVEPAIETPMCRAEWQTTTLDLVAPPDAEMAVAYAIGHDPGVSIEVDSVSLRE